MKLIGSKTETEFRCSLTASHIRHFSSDSNTSLKSYLRSQNIPFEKAYILNEIPEESTEYYSILISGSTIITVEIDKCTTQNCNIQSTIALKHYLVGLSKIEQIKLFVAKELSGM